MFRWLGAGIVLGSVATSTVAFADAVPGPPKDCPRGAIGQTGHSGQWCDPHECQSDADCKHIWGGSSYVAGRCESTSLCVRRRMVRTNHRVAPAPDGAVAMHERAYGVSPCKDGACDDAEAKCETAKRCVVADVAAPVGSAPSTSTPGRGCGCGKTTAGPKSNALVGLLVGAWLLRRTRSRC